MCLSSKSMLYLPAMISTAADTSFIQKKLSHSNWKQYKQNHRDRISDLIDNYLERRQHQHKDPIMDFLFEYYAFRPSHLKRWSPGFGVMLEGDSRSDYPNLSELVISETGAFLDPKQFPDNRKSSLQWMLTVLENSQERKPAFGCFGMHEWAMVYKRDKVRHQQLPLRMSKEEIAEFVESRPLVCTHFDAFRFFSEPAKPLNKHELSRDAFADSEQPGCLHTNMDLYKWAFKGYPWISSHTIRKAFELALEARYVDMKASPYDLSDRGLKPIKIETGAGRLEYLEKQQDIYRKSIPVRKQLIEEYKALTTYIKL